MSPTLIEQVLYAQVSSVKMDSPLAADWSPEMDLLFRFSKKEAKRKLHIPRPPPDYKRDFQSLFQVFLI